MTAPPPPQSRGQAFVKLLMLAGTLSVVGLLLLGIPGALWMIPGETLVPLVFGRGPHGDTAWPIAIMVSLIWPWFIPALHWLLTPRTRPGWPRALAVAGTTAAASVGVALTFQILAL